VDELGRRKDGKLLLMDEFVVPRLRVVLIEEISSDAQRETARESMDELLPIPSLVGPKRKTFDEDADSPLFGAEGYPRVPAQGQPRRGDSKLNVLTGSKREVMSFLR